MPKKNGFTLIELLVVIVIISILAVVSVVLFTNVSKGARDSRRQQDIIAIAKGYENKALVGIYQSLAEADFSSGKIPTDPNTSRGDGTGSYYNVRADNGSWFKACAALDNNPNQYCNNTSNNCFCKPSSQGTVNASHYSGTGSQIGLGGSSLTHSSSCDPDGTLDDELIAYWRMDESSWSGTSGEVSDSTGNGKNGTAQSGTNTTTGKFYNAGNFNGTSNYINFAGWPGITSANFSVTAWIYPTKDGDDNFKIIGLQQYCNRTSQFALTYRRTTARFLVCNTVGIGLEIISVTVPTDSWHFVVGTFDGSATKVYVDGGAPVTGSTFTGTFPTSSLTEPFVIGRSNLVGPVYYGGKIDDVRIYNRVLSNTGPNNEIANLYNNGNGCIP